MNYVQKKLVTKLVFVVLLLATLPMFHHWISSHLRILGWGLFALIIVSALGKQKSIHIPTYDERHLEFNRVLDENPWMKIYYVVFTMAVAIGFYYTITNNVNILEDIGFLGAYGLISLVMLPVIIFKVRQAYIDAGEDV
jgi:hypothetical protein